MVRNLRFVQALEQVSMNPLDLRLEGKTAFTSSNSNWIMNLGDCRKKMALNSCLHFPKHQSLTCRCHTLLGICISLLCCMNGLANTSASINLMLQAVNPGSSLEEEGRYDQPRQALFPAAGRVKYPCLWVFLLQCSPCLSYCLHKLICALSAPALRWL